MSDRALRQAIRALQTIEAEHHLAEATERRVLSTLRQRAQRKRAIRSVAYLLSFSLCVAASAHAAVRGPAETWRAVAELWRRSVHEGVARPRPARAARAPRAAIARAAPAGRDEAAKSVARAAEDPSAQLSPPAPAPASRARKVAVPRAPDRVRERVLAPELSPPAQDAPSPDALYSEAHQLHFVTGDKYAALRAWDAYLAAAPDGTFAPEAHYNRAVCLVALGRTEVALSALRAIAAGEQASYRAHDAARLVRALEDHAR